MSDVSSHRHYWGTVVDALSCIYLYQSAVTEEFKCQIRYHEFPDAVQRARIAYYYCESFPRRDFGLVGDEIDQFFSNMLIHGYHLDKIYSQSVDNHCLGSTPIPMRLL